MACKKALATREKLLVPMPGEVQDEDLEALLGPWQVDRRTRKVFAAIARSCRMPRGLSRKPTRRQRRKAARMVASVVRLRNHARPGFTDSGERSQQHAGHKQTGDQGQPWIEAKVPASTVKTLRTCEAGLSVGRAELEVGSCKRTVPTCFSDDP